MNNWVEIDDGHYATMGPHKAPHMRVIKEWSYTYRCYSTHVGVVHVTITVMASNEQTARNKIQRMGYGIIPVGCRIKRIK